MVVRDIISIATVAFSLFSLLLAFFAFQGSRKPALICWIQKSPFDHIYNPDYFYLKNKSRNRADDVSIELVYKIHGLEDTKKIERIDYLNPGDTMHCVLSIKEIFEKHPKIFKKIKSEGKHKAELTTPKSSMNIFIKVKIISTYKIFWRLNFQEEFHDTFSMDWTSFERYGDTEKFPETIVYHRRNEKYIENDSEPNFDK